MWDAGRLRLLRELELRGTITAVAHTLNFSISTVSQQLGQLERELGMPLLERDGRRVKLTRQGQIVARHAAAMMDAQEIAEGELAALRLDEETVRVAAFDTAAFALIPRALSALAGTHPHLRLDVAVVPPEEGLFELEARRFDLTIAEQYPGQTRRIHAGVDRVHVGTDRLRLAVPPDSPVASLAGAAELPWAMEPHGAFVRDWIVQQCRASGFEPQVRYEATDLFVHVELVSAGHAVAVLPGLACTGGQAGRLRLIDLPGSPRREFFSSARPVSRKRPAVQAVHHAICAAAAMLAAELELDESS